MRFSQWKIGKYTRWASCWDQYSGVSAITGNCHLWTEISKRRTIMQATVCTFIINRKKKSNLLTKFFNGLLQIRPATVVKDYRLFFFLFTNTSLDCFSFLLVYYASLCTNSARSGHSWSVSLKITVVEHLFAKDWNRNFLFFHYTVLQFLEWQLHYLWQQRDGFITRVFHFWRVSSRA